MSPSIRKEAITQPRKNAEPVLSPKVLPPKVLPPKKLEAPVNQTLIEFPPILANGGSFPISPRLDEGSIGYLKSVRRESRKKLHQSPSIEDSQGTLNQNAVEKCS